MIFFSKTALIGSIVTLTLGNAAAIADRTLQAPDLGKFEPFGYQSIDSNGHDTGTSVAASPNPEQGFFLTGTTTGIALSPEAENALHVGMHCYVMQVKPFQDNWVWVKKFGAYKNGVPVGTTCTSIDTIAGEDATQIVVAGYTEGDEIFNPETGILDFSLDTTDPEVEQMQTNQINGFVIVLEIPNAHVEKDEFNSADVEIIGGKVLAQRNVQYPVKVITHDDSTIAIASMVTDDGSQNVGTTLAQGLGQVGDFEPVYKYGNFFEVQVESLFLNEGSDVMVRQWVQNFDTDDRRGAFVTSLAYDRVDDKVIFGGTTHGSGVAFGTAGSESSGSDFDGYVSRLDKFTGDLDLVKADPVRVEANPGKDIFINSICVHGEAMFIVGSTNDIIDPSYEGRVDEFGTVKKLNAFIQKRQLSNFNIIWTRQIGAATVLDDTAADEQDVEGLGCAIAHDQLKVYVSGVVHSGASVVTGKPGAGNKDIFVKAYQLISGTPLNDFPTTQVGSVFDDIAAKDGGGLTIDQYGNAVLYGTTDGDFLVQKPGGITAFAQSYSDIFLMSFLEPSAEHVPAVTLLDPVAPTVTIVQETGMRKSLLITLISVSSALGFVLILLVAFTCRNRRKRSEIETQQDQDIAKYLEEFEGQAGQTADASNNYGQADLSAGQGQDSVLPGEVSFDTSGGKSSKTTYDELMDSYKNIQQDLAAAESGENFTIDNPNPDNDRMVV